MRKRAKEKKSHFKMMQNITNCGFLHSLEGMIEILNSLHNCQVMLRFGDAHSGYVI